MDQEDALSTAKALADRSRLRLLRALTSGPRCVEELATTLELAPSTVSFHLKKLAESGLVSAEKDQYYTIYALRPEKLVTTLAELLDFEDPQEQRGVARVSDDRQKVLGTFFSGGRLLKMPVQKRKRNTVLEQFVPLFEPLHDYTEQEVNEAITPVFADYCLVRRLLVDEGFLARSGGIYRRTERAPGPATVVTDGGASCASKEKGMDATKKRLKKEYQLRERVAGVFHFRNDRTGRVLLGSSLHLDNPLNRLQFQLETGTHMNRDLQSDYERYGRESFTFQVLEVVEPTGAAGFDVKAALEELEQRHLAALDRSNTYNNSDRIRFP